MLRDVCFQDNATAGEAAGYAMGLIMLGTGSTKVIDEMLHEKIIRSIAICIALVEYGRAEAADETIERLMAEKVSAGFGPNEKS
jgi:26S proteasome regulatory subunit N2